MTVLALDKGTKVIKTNTPCVCESLHRHADGLEYLFYLPEHDAIAIGDNISGAVKRDNLWARYVIAFYGLEKILEELVSKGNNIKPSNFDVSDRIFGVKEGVEEANFKEDVNRFMMMSSGKGHWNKFGVITPRDLPKNGNGCKQYNVDSEWGYPIRLLEAQSGQRRHLTDHVMHPDSTMYQDYPPIQEISDGITNQKDWLKMILENDHEFTEAWGNSVRGTYKVSSIIPEKAKPIVEEIINS